MSNVRERITEDLKAAMKAQDQIKIATLRMIKTEILKRETEIGKDLDEAGFIKMLKAMKKQRQETIEEFKKFNRLEAMEKEQKELAFLETYLPQEMSVQEIEAIVVATIAECGAKDMKAMGNVMKAVMAKIAGKADGKQVNAIVRAKLSQ